MENNIEKNIVSIKKSTLVILFIVLALVVVFFYFILGNSGNGGGEVVVTPVEGSTFLNTGDNLLVDVSGKPYVLLFSTTWCPHCAWIKDTFDALAQSEFANQVNIQHWEVDTGDNTLTSEVETQVPGEMLDIYKKYNPSGSIPTFIFGGKYIRIGTGYERQNDLNAETTDFKFIIGKLLE